MNRGIVGQTINSVRNGNLEDLEILYQHYYKVFKRYLDNNREIENIEEKYKYIIIKRIEAYFKNNCISALCDYINYTFELADKYKIWDFDKLNEFRSMPKPSPVRDLVQEAATNSDARKKLIEKYMYIVERELDNCELDIEYEDALQMGYLLLVKSVNRYLENYEVNKKYDFSTYIITSIHASYTSLIRHVNYDQRNYMHYKNSIDYVDSFEDVVLEKILMENVREVIKNCNFSGIREDVLTFRYGFNGEINSLKAIADKHNVTAEWIRQVDKKNLEKIKKELETKVFSDNIKEMQMSKKLIK